jgi:hypothetical protein
LGHRVVFHKGSMGSWGDRSAPFGASPGLFRPNAGCAEPLETHFHLKCIRQNPAQCQTANFDRPSRLASGQCFVAARQQRPAPNGQPSPSRTAWNREQVK